MKENQGSASPRKKVLFVITKSNFGGAQRYVYDLATSLPMDRFEVTVAFGGTGTIGSAPGSLASMLADAGIRTLMIPELARDINIKLETQAFFALVRLFKRERPHIVHLNSSKVGGLGAIAARIINVFTRRSLGEVGPRIVFTAHGWPFWEPRHIFARSIIFFLSYLTVLLSHRTICISEYDTRSIRKMPFTARRLTMIHNGLSPIDFFSRDAARQKLFSESATAAHAQDMWIVTNAELHPNKNLLVGIDAVAAHNAIHNTKILYSIMGTGEMQTQIEQYIHARNLGEHVKLLGFVPDGRRYMRAFDTLFLPSKKEGVPYVLLEAGAAGLPVVASDVGGIPEIIIDGESGYLRAPDDILGFTEALGKLAADPTLRDQMGQKLAENISGDFSLESMMKEVTKMYMM
ncbi:glycosyltransferase family 4 protein [Candidatus Kaiserbacteria bacterium]|nr:glycosyltransferase family 4 protein [Candidatus Kaiserbacteria bacterium]